MSNHVALMTQAFKLLERRDLDGCTALLTDDFRINLAGMPEPQTGKDAWRGNAEYLLSAFSDLEIRVDDTLVSGDRVVCLVTLTGTHTGDFIGHAATGRRVTWVSYEIYRITDGLISEEWICSDLFGLVSQLHVAA